MADWHSIDVGGFELLSDADAATLQRLANRVHMIRSLVEEVTNVTTTRPDFPMRIFVFRDDREWNALLGDDAARVAGFFAPTLRGSYIALSLQRTPGRTHEVLYHEIVHFSLHNGQTRNYPTWYDEGLASLLQSAALREGTVTLGSAPAGARDAIQNSEPLPLGALLSQTSTLEMSPEDAARFYADAWAFTHYLHTHRTPDGTRRHAQLGALLDRIDRGVPWREAIPAAFGVDPDVLESEFRGHRAEIGKGIDKVVVLPAEDLARAKRWTAIAVDPVRIAYRLGELARAIDRPELCRAFLARALAREPGFAAARADLAHALAEASRREEADRELAIALKESPQDYRVLLGLGYRELDRAEGDDGNRDLEALRAARAAFRRSAARAPSGVIEPHTMLGNSYLMAEAGDDVAEGIEALEQAYAVVGWHPKVNLWLGMLYARAGQPQRAIQHLRVAANWSHGSTEDWWQAVELLDELGVAQP